VGVMPGDDQLYPGVDIDATDEERAADQQRQMDAIMDANSGLDHTQFSVPSGNPTIPPGPGASAEYEQSYYEWITNGIQNLVESIAPPDHPVMITP
jgi:hypothetical protein